MQKRERQSVPTSRLEADKADSATVLEWVHEDFLKLSAENKTGALGVAGDILIVYGKPSKIENDVICLDPWYYLREIGTGWFTHTDEMYVENGRDMTHGR